MNMTDGSNNGIQSKYLAIYDDTTESIDDAQIADSSVNLEFASVESDGRETYNSEDSVSKKPEPRDMYKSLQDDFQHTEIQIDAFRSPVENSGFISTKLYDSSPSEATVMREDVFYVDDDMDRTPSISGIMLPLAVRTNAELSELTTAEEVTRLECVLRRWQASITEENETEFGSPSSIVSRGELAPLPNSPLPSEALYPTFTEISLQEAVTACLGISIQPTHYSASAVLRHTNPSPMTCCISSPANDFKSATDRALVFAVADWRYNESCPVHWQTLATIYSKYTGEANTVYRYGSHWEKIGFQGSDPVTDLRSAGYLGLLHLFYMATQASALAQQCYHLSINPQSQFPMAITGLNLTKMVMTAIRSGRLKVGRNRSAVFNAHHVGASDRFLIASCKLYISLWQQYATTWSSKNCTILNSHEVLQKLEKLAVKQANALLKKANSYLNCYVNSLQRPLSFKKRATDGYLNSKANVKPSSVNARKEEIEHENITYTDIAAI